VFEFKCSQGLLEISYKQSFKQEEALPKRSSAKRMWSQMQSLRRNRAVCRFGQDNVRFGSGERLGFLRRAPPDVSRNRNFNDFIKTDDFL